MPPKDERGYLIKQRATVKGTLTRFKNFFDKNAVASKVSQIKVRLDEVKKCLGQFNSIQEQIELLDENEDEVERDTFETKYFQLIGDVENFIQGCEVKPDVKSNSSFNVNKQVNLPILNLPTFSGQFDEFSSFSNAFKTIIDENPNLQATQKFYYLKAALKGEVASILQSLDASECSYKTAWDLLKARYENKRFVVSKHVKALFNQNKVEKQSARSIRQLIDTTQKHLRALESLGELTSQWDTIIIHILESKLDQNTFVNWEGTLTNEIPKLQQMINFLEGKCQQLEIIEDRTVGNKFGINTSTPQSKLKFKERVMPSYVSTVIGCGLCKENHQIYLCNKFKGLKVQDREAHVKKLGLCFNCLSSSDHRTKNCVKGSCKLCGKRHNTLLHYKEESSENQNQGANADSCQPCSNSAGNHQVKAVVSTSSHTSYGGAHSSVLLSTAVVHVLDRHGTPHWCRILLDSASQSHFITEKAARRLGLSSTNVSVEICGIGQSTSKTSNMVQCVIKSRINSFSANIQCIVMKSITNKLPTVFFERSEFEIPSNLQLADPNFNEPGDIDILVGAELFFDVLCEGSFKQTESSPILKNSVFGWIVSGRFKVNIDSNVSVCHLTTLDDINKNIQRFWELEDCGDEKQYTGNDRLAEDHFMKTTTRDASGRYSVSLPLKGDVTDLGDSKDTALRRLLSLERRLSTNPELHSQYVQFMRDYEDLGHMKQITTEDAQSSAVYYIPHHPVFKADSLTTKVRVVFDCSAKTSSNKSLNDISIVGPTVQSDLITIVTRFRKHPYVITGDIEKMYRQININPPDQNLQLILWRENPKDSVKTYRLSTVSYGQASAPYLATRTLKQLAIDEQSDFPVASKVLIEDTYIDDVMTGAATREEAKQLRKDLCEITKRGGFHLRKWAANHPDILSNISSENMDNDCVEVDQDSTVKTLGLLWSPREDTFQFFFNQRNMTSSNPTKREILSTTGKLFDPLGLVGATTVIAKQIMQQVWSCRIDWDQELPEILCKRWLSFQETLHVLSQLRIPRAIVDRETSSIEIHGFSDSSELAYGACVYLKCIYTNGDISVRLIATKTRVAPLKRVSLPRLELSASLLLSELGKTLVKALQLNISSVTYYTDSTVTLAWIHSPSSHWTTFVANRVAKIQDNTQSVLTQLNQVVDTLPWKHVVSQQNPADFLSRGLLPTEIIHADTYWSGPSFLHSNQVPEFNIDLPMVEEMPERRKVILSATVNPDSESIINFQDYSSFVKLKRVMGFCLRFIKNCQSSREQRSTGKFLSTTELHSAEMALIKIVQKESFLCEYKALQRKKAIARKGNLLSLNPFLDEDQIMRVGGRLQKSDLSADQIHPIILPKGHVFCELIARHLHVTTLHSGPKLLLSVIRQKYWPINGQNLVKKIFRTCIRCFKTNPKVQTQIMGQLPEARVQRPGRAFSTTGVDYCGPFYVKISKARKTSPVKCYIALFVCFSTKAIHLELVEDMTTEAFLAAFRRFISRRGKPSQVFSDNGTNFVGGNRELQRNFEEGVAAESADEQILWHFQPPRAPNFGGLYESSVKLIKTHIKRVLGNTILTFVQFNTLIIEIEACVNSRPLTPISNHPCDVLPLTPSHFLIGEQLSKPPEPSYCDLKPNLLSRWEQTQQLFQTFWTRWSRDYLHTLQERTKWRTQSPNVNLGDLVILKDDNQPPLHWRSGRIVGLHPGHDNNVRVVTVKTSSGEVKRPISKLCVLPVNSE